MVTSFTCKKDCIETVEKSIVYSISILNDELGGAITHILFPETNLGMDMYFEERRSFPNDYVVECVTDYFSHHKDFKYLTEYGDHMAEHYCEINGAVVKSTAPFFFLAGDGVVIHVLYQYLVTALMHNLNEDSIKNHIYDKVMLLKERISRMEP